MKPPSLFDPRGPVEPALADQAARDFAVDPANDVVLEASAGTGKTGVLVARYVRLIEAGVDPHHILAVTFTRKAAAEMRERVLAGLRRRAAEGAIRPAAWRILRDRITEIQVSTIDAFCYGLLREFPLEADVDPGFEIADETEIARFANEALDLTLRAARALLPHDEPVRLLFARVRTPVLRAAIAGLLDRRQIAVPAVRDFVARRARVRSAAPAAAVFAGLLRDLFRSADRAAFLEDGPAAAPEFQRLRDDVSGLDADLDRGPAWAQRIRRRLERYFLTRGGQPRKRLDASFTAAVFGSPAARRRHEHAVQALAPAVASALDTLDAHVNGLLARGLLRVLTIAVEHYERLLDEHALLDFAGLLDRSVRLLARQEEFARSRLKLQSRYHHVLVDEFQDTSRLQWRLVELLVDAWGEGEGVTDAPTSIFIVGDRKQSIYRFRHAEVTLLDEAARKISILRPHRRVRQAITTSFRAVPELLAFVNALSSSVQSGDTIDERFVFGETDRFPVPEVNAGALRDGAPVLGLVAESSMAASARAVAAEIDRLLAGALVRDRHGPPRPARPDDIAILFRARAGHQYFEDALESRGIRTYVYKGLGFFDAPEVQDLQALIRYLAQPDSDLRAAELLRSRLVRVSDIALSRIAPAFAPALRDPAWQPPALDAIDAALLAAARDGVARWLSLADRLTPGELIDLVVRESAYAAELTGRRRDQSRENIKKLRGLIRRVESRGYATLDRLARYFETLRGGDESNAIVGASGCVNLMTMHAAKGLEFPIVFAVNLHLPGRGRPPGFTVIERGIDGAPDVAFGASGATVLEDQREAEELRRLLYVAITRARDRLYLAGVVDEHARLQRGARSLASLLPADLVHTFGAAAGDPAASQVTWASANGAFTFSICRAGPDVVAPAAAESPEDRGEIDAAPLSHPPGSRPATSMIGSAPDRAPRDGSAPDSHARLLGTLVHRLFRRHLDPSCDLASVRELASVEVRSVEFCDVSDRDALAHRAAEMYVTLRGRPDVAALLASGTCHYEVPISCRIPGESGQIIRGIIDCVVVTADGAATLVEFKTGRPRPEHEAQAAIYARALASALRFRAVNVTILYA